MRLRFLFVLVATAVVLPLATLACKDGGDGGGADTKTAVAVSPTSDTFDYNKLTAIVLRPEDVPVDLPGLAGTFNAGAANGVSFTTWYGTESLQLQSTVGRYSDPISREESFDHIPRGNAPHTQYERNYDLAGADLAFIYRSSDLPITSILVFQGDFFILVTLQSNDETRTADAYDEEALGGYAKIVFDRLLGLIADPESITPIVGAAQFQSPVPAADTPTRAATGTPES